VGKKSTVKGKEKGGRIKKEKQRSKLHRQKMRAYDTGRFRVPRSEWLKGQRAGLFAQKKESTVRKRSIAGAPEFNKSGNQSSDRK